MFFVALALACAPYFVPAPELRARVDARVELFSTIARLADFAEYNEAVAESPYSAAVDEHFAPYRVHAAVTLAKQLRRTAQIGYDAIALLALHVDRATGGERFDLAVHLGRLEGRWSSADARAFIAAAQDFRTESGFDAFFASQSAYTNEAAQRLTRATEGRPQRAWFDATFGAKPGATFELVLALLIGGHNFGVGLRRPDGTEELAACIGAWTFDEAGVPVFGDALGWVVPHEFTHSYVNPIVDRHYAALAPSGATLFQRVAAVMRDQAYSDWRIVLYESLTRACVIRYLLATEGQPAANEQARADLAQGFLWIAQLAQLLGQFEAQRERYATFDDFMPQVVALFDAMAAKDRTFDDARPRLVALTPANGARDVPADLPAIVLTFDKPMKQKWSLMTSAAGPFPTLAGEIAFDAERKVLTVPVKLAPGTTYGFWINSATGRGFASEQGVVLDPIPVTFSTR